MANIIYAHAHRPPDAAYKPEEWNRVWSESSMLAEAAACRSTLLHETPVESIWTVLVEEAVDAPWRFIPVRGVSAFVRQIDFPGHRNSTPAVWPLVMRDADSGYTVYGSLCFNDHHCIMFGRREIPVPPGGLDVSFHGQIHVTFRLLPKGKTDDR